MNVKRNPSFGNFAVGLATFIENNGFMGEFLTIDTCGMGIPRAGQGYLRNHKELGHLNYKAGHEEVTRELLSGPAFFFVPFLTIAAVSMVKGKSAKVTSKTLESFKSLMEKTPVEMKNATATKKNFVKTVVKEAFGEYKNEKPLVDELASIMERNATEKFSVKDKFLNLFRKDGEKVETRAILKEKAETILTKLNKANEKFLDNTGAMKLGAADNSGSEVKTVLSDMKNYLDDFTSKAAKSEKDKASFVESFHKNAKNMRTAAEILAIAALSTFLVYIPKLYQTGKNFPGKDGLVAQPKNADTAPENKSKEAV